jgi:ABC-2 type transport system ATP-binding protein
LDPQSRRQLWEIIRTLRAQGRTVLLTTHYMDEAERCHRLAFIFGGELLDIGTPDEIVQRRTLRVAELEVDRASDAATLLRTESDVEEVAHFGHVLRVATRHGRDPVALARDLLAAHGLAVRSAREARASVEDAFVAMVRSSQRAAEVSR